MKHFLILSIIAVLSTSMQAQIIWEPQPVTLGPVVKGMHYDDSLDVSYIFGAYNIAWDSTNVIVYDGSSFYGLPKCPVYNIWDMQVYRGKLYAGGTKGATHALAVWDGVSWESIETSKSGIIFNLKVIDDKLYVLGNQDSVAGVYTRGIAVYNDTAWSSLLGIDSVITVSNTIHDVEFYKGKVYVAGNFYNWDNPELEDLMMHDGERWEPVGSFEGSALGSAKRMLVWRDTLYVAGMYLEHEGNPGNNIAAWDGDNWHRLQDGVNVLSGGSGGSVIRDMKVYNDELWVCGFFNVVNGRYVHDKYGGLAKWNGMEWCTMNLWKIGDITQLGTWRDELFLAGEFLLEGEPEGNRLVKWVGGDYTDTCVGLSTTGIATNADGISDLKLYPNPSSERINIDFYLSRIPSSIGQIKIEIVDVMGRVLLSDLIMSNLGYNHFDMDISRLAKGNYLVQMSGDSPLASIQFIKH